MNIAKFRKENLELTLFMNDEEVLKEIEKRKSAIKNKKIVAKKIISNKIVKQEQGFNAIWANLKLGDKLRYNLKLLKLWQLIKIIQLLDSPKLSYQN